MAHKIIVRVSPEGKTEVQVDGMAGASCTDVTKAVEKALGKTVTDKKTTDYYKAQASVNQNQGQGGN